MKLAIIAAEAVPRYYPLLDKKINQLIETSGCFLFFVLCGYIDREKSKQTELAEIWATRNGAPVLYTHEKTANKMLNQIILNADYVIFILDGDPLINNCFMKYKMMGKHGTVIKV